MIICKNLSIHRIIGAEGTHRKAAITRDNNKTDLNIVVIPFSHLLQQMLVLRLHIFICLSNSLQESEELFNKNKAFQSVTSAAHPETRRGWGKKRQISEGTSISDIYASDSASLTLIASVSSKISLKVQWAWTQKRWLINKTRLCNL